jgi:hypothetical protein
LTVVTKRRRKEEKQGIYGSFLSLSLSASERVCVYTLGDCISFLFGLPTFTVDSIYNRPRSFCPDDGRKRVEERKKKRERRKLSISFSTV